MQLHDRKQLLLERPADLAKHLPHPALQQEQQRQQPRQQQRQRRRLQRQQQHLQQVRAKLQPLAGPAALSVAVAAQDVEPRPAAPSRRLQKQAQSQDLPAHLTAIGADAAWSYSKGAGKADHLGRWRGWQSKHAIWAHLHGMDPSARLAFQGDGSSGCRTCCLFAGQRTLVVAVLDTGVDVSHPDLARSLWVNAGEVPGNGLDDDGNGVARGAAGSFAWQCFEGAILGAQQNPGPYQRRQRPQP